jgi:hypothetical protein
MFYNPLDLNIFEKAIFLNDNTFVRFNLPSVLKKKPILTLSDKIS